MLTRQERLLAAKLVNAAVAVAVVKRRLAEAQRDYDRLYREVERRGRWNQKRREARALRKA